MRYWRFLKNPTLVLIYFIVAVGDGIRDRLGLPWPSMAFVNKKIQSFAVINNPPGSY
jgi:hypothetical protein